MNVRTRMAEAGWTVGSSVYRGAKFSRPTKDGGMEYADLRGEPVELTDEPAGDVADKPDGLLGEAMTKLETAGPETVARLLMGANIDKPTLVHLTDTMAIDDALGEYSTDDIRTWLARLNVDTKSKQRAQLVQLVATAIGPEPAPEPASITEPPDEDQDDDREEA